MDTVSSPITQLKESLAKERSLVNKLQTFIIPITLCVPGFLLLTAMAISFVRPGWVPLVLTIASIISFITLLIWWVGNVNLDIEEEQNLQDNLILNINRQMKDEE